MSVKSRLIICFLIRFFQRFSVVIPFVCFLFLLPAESPAVDRYVSTGGDNGNAGSQLLPWRTVQYAVDHVSGGDTIFVRAGTYTEKISFSGVSDSGSAASGYVILKNYPGESVILDGTTLSPVDMEGLLSIIDASYIKVTGFEISNFKTSNNSKTPVGIFIEGTSHHLTIKDNVVHDIEMNANDGGAHGIAVYGTDANTAISDLEIDGNEVYDCILGWSEALVLNGNVKDFIVANNTVHDCDNIGYDFIGFEGECGSCTTSDPDNLDQARDGLVQNNIAYNIDTKDNPAYGNERSAAGFYVDGGKDIIFERNSVSNSNMGFELASEHQGKATENIIVRNNFIYKNHVAGISTGGYQSNKGSASNCQVLNNTLYKNSNSLRPEDDWGAEILLQFNNLNNIYKNNIVYAASGKVRVDEGGGTNIGNSFDYNLYYGSNQGTAPGLNSKSGDPQLNDPENGDLHLSVSTSPAVDGGVNLSLSEMGEADIDSKSRIYNDVVDIGAHEFGSIGVPEKYGDLNNDTIVDLTDLILSLQVLSGQNPSIIIESDVNNNGKTGMEEVLYILLDVSGSSN